MPESAAARSYGNVQILADGLSGGRPWPGEQSERCRGHHPAMGSYLLGQSSDLPARSSAGPELPRDTFAESALKLRFPVPLRRAMLVLVEIEQPLQQRELSTEGSDDCMRFFKVVCAREFAGSRASRRSCRRRSVHDSQPVRRWKDCPDLARRIAKAMESQPIVRRVRAPLSVNFELAFSARPRAPAAQRSAPRHHRKRTASSTSFLALQARKMAKPQPASMALNAMDDRRIKAIRPLIPPQVRLTGSFERWCTTEQLDLPRRRSSWKTTL